NSKKIRTPRTPMGIKKLLAFAIIVSLVAGVPLWGYDYAYHPYSKTTVVVVPMVSVNPTTNQTVSTTSTTTSYSNPITNPLQNFAYYFTYQSSLTGCGTINSWNCYPWNWILPIDASPLAYYVNTVTVTTT